MKTIILNNGVEMPILGFGVYQVTPEETEQVVSNALEVGYRSLDTAQAYYNEEGVGKAITKSGISRKDIFLTTKVWVSNAGYEKAKASIDESLKKLQTSYIDLLLIHQPFGDYYGTYRAMEDAYKEGKVRAIGVSNFYPDRYIDLVEHNNIVPAINQLETNIFNGQIESEKIMQEYGTQLESWAPFAEGKNNFFNNEILTAIGEKYHKSVAQVTLRYFIQRQVVLIPKTVNKERMIENLSVFDFELSNEDMKQIAALNKEETAFFSHRDPELVKFILNYDKNNRS
ncbi:Aldo/keto reductase [Pustulibacterium marinum]|uniref:Aldo/keto reductase n=1 Tax=Pustulibacterium marinum TaxID=1224947 RepID=A0A1I7I9N8_9FLAO|nr:aldo/keto reductase [Pustulibacterium marinum]SFU69628.1 Aldo/keto reductase [Pustulibacterium marinum]